MNILSYLPIRKFQIRFKKPRNKKISIPYGCIISNFKSRQHGGESSKINIKKIILRIETIQMIEKIPEILVQIENIQKNHFETRGSDDCKNDKLFDLELFLL